MKLLEVEWKDDQVKARVESPICANMNTVLRDEDLRLLIPHSMELDGGMKVSLLQKWCGKYIEINNIKGKEKIGKRDRKMKLTVTIENAEGFQSEEFLDEAIKMEEITGFPKKVDGTTIEVELSEATLGGKAKCPATIKKVETLAFLKKFRALVEANHAGWKGYSLSDK